MTKYEKMLITAKDENVSINEKYKFESPRIKGLYCDSNVALNYQIDTDIERGCILAEELGHHFTTIGNIIDLNNEGNCKQEHKARVWAYSNMLDLNELIDAYRNGCRNRYEIADHLGVTEQFLDEVLVFFQQQYGLYKKLENHIIYFDPLGVAEIYI